MENKFANTGNQRLSLAALRVAGKMLSGINPGNNGVDYSRHE